MLSQVTTCRYLNKYVLLELDRQMYAKRSFFIHLVHSCIWVSLHTNWFITGMKQVKLDRPWVKPIWVQKKFFWRKFCQIWSNFGRWCFVLWPPLKNGKSNKSSSKHFKTKNWVLFWCRCVLKLERVKMELRAHPGKAQLMPLSSS